MRRSIYIDKTNKFVLFFLEKLPVLSFMATVLASQYGVREDTVFLVFDIEAIGNVYKPSECRLWNLAACVLGKPSDKIDLYVQPAIEDFTTEYQPDHQFSNITPEKLDTLGATTFQVAMSTFMQWVVAKKSNPDTAVILCSHGCFRYDKILLEYEFMRNGMYLPQNIYFFDTLHWSRQVLRGRAAFSLSSIYKDMFEHEIDDPHKALSDALALNHVMSTLLCAGNILTGVMYPPYFTPLVRIPGVGMGTERLLVSKNVRCVEELSIMFTELFRDCEPFFTSHLISLGLSNCTAAAIVSFLQKQDS